MRTSLLRQRTLLVLTLAVGLLAGACASWDLRQMVIHGDLVKTQRQVEGRGQSPESPDDCGWTLLHYASYYQHAPLVEYLIGRMVNVNARSTMHSENCVAYSKIPAGSTPLIIAAYYGQIDIIELLLRYGADRTIKNDGGYTALMYAKKFEFAEAARALGAAGRDEE
jgi:ankyrin repeat protein